MKTMLTFEEVDRLLDEVMAFLLECGGPYQCEDGRLQKNVLECLAVGQFVIHRGPAGEITHFLCYWMITPGEVGDTVDRIRPLDFTGGTVMFVLKHGNKDGRPGMTRMVKDLRQKEPQTVGTAWRHKGEAIKHFPNQRSGKKAATSQDKGTLAVEPKKTPLEELAETMWKIRQHLHSLIVEAKSAPEISRDMELRILSLQEELVHEAVKQVDIVMLLNKDLTDEARKANSERHRLENENKKLWEAALSNKTFTYQGVS